MAHPRRPAPVGRAVSGSLAGRRVGYRLGCSMLGSRLPAADHNTGEAQCAARALSAPRRTSPTTAARPEPGRTAWSSPCARRRCGPRAYAQVVKAIPVSPMPEEHHPGDGTAGRVGEFAGRPRGERQRRDQPGVDPSAARPLHQHPRGVEDGGEEAADDAKRIHRTASVATNDDAARADVPGERRCEIADRQTSGRAAAAVVTT